MCGRFTLWANPCEFEEAFAVVRQFDEEWRPSYNVAPTQRVICVRDGERREFFKAKWGLIPSWAKDAKIGNSCINARRNGRHETSLPLGLQEAAMPGHGRWLLRMAAR